jgi:D-alanyl-D-alanine carboxypeptidase
VRGGPAGGGYSTAPDVLKFAAALRNGLLLKPATLTEFTTGKVELAPGHRYGYGFVDTTLRGHRIVGHSGGFPGINSLDMFSNDGWAVAVMSNIDAGAIELQTMARELIATER